MGGASWTSENDGRYPELLQLSLSLLLVLLLVARHKGAPTRPRGHLGEMAVDPTAVQPVEHILRPVAGVPLDRTRSQLLTH